MSTSYTEYWQLRLNDIMIIIRCHLWWSARGVADFIKHSTEIISFSEPKLIRENVRLLVFRAKLLSACIQTLACNDTIDKCKYCLLHWVFLETAGDWNHELSKHATCVRAVLFCTAANAFLFVFYI